MSSKNKKLKVFVFSGLILIIAGSCFIYFRFFYSGQAHLNPVFYPMELDSIKQIKKSLASNYNTQKAKSIFVKCMTEKIFPYWYGTRWDFNGTTETPQKGSIACGYFVTTTLRDAGVTLNRVTLARCPSEEMIRALVSKQHIKHYPGISLGEFDKKLTAAKPGLYIIGLDNHTGFIHVSSKGNFFIHASGRFPFRVTREKISESKVLKKSKYKVLGKISDDITFLKNWLGKSI